MLAELRVQELGVIEDVTLVLGPGMTVLTGETGAGKTLLVEAISVLSGGPAPGSLVRPGAGEASVEARFAPTAGSLGRPPVEAEAGVETVLLRVVPSGGRSRAYVNGRMVSVSQLAETGRGLVDLHGQHAHQSLLSSASQRRALDEAGGISLQAVHAVREELRRLREALGALGGDERGRAREIDTLRYQLDDLDRAEIRDADEEIVLRDEEAQLADAAGIRQAALGAWSALSEEDGACDALARLVSQLAGRPALAELHERLADAREELVDAATEARILAERIEEDPERLEAVRARLVLLGGLRRRYGETLGEVIAFGEDLHRRLRELEGYEERALELDHAVADAEEALTAANSAVFAARLEVAPVLAGAVTFRLHDLAMPRARFGIDVAPGSDGGSVTWMLGANPGEPMLPLSRVASGGELARTMLAARLAVVLAGGGRPGEDPGVDDAGPPTLVFDEVDAGVGGEAAVAVGRALSDLAGSYQVLVVTHLPQVAAFAERHYVVRKDLAGGRTVATVSEVSGDDRVVELARMLSGRPDSETARLHAEELLGSASSPRAVG